MYLTQFSNGEEMHAKFFGDSSFSETFCFVKWLHRSLTVCMFLNKELNLRPTREYCSTSTLTAAICRALKPKM